MVSVLQDEDSPNFASSLERLLTWADTRLVPVLRGQHCAAHRHKKSRRLLAASDATLLADPDSLSHSQSLQPPPSADCTLLSTTLLSETLVGGLSRRTAGEEDAQYELVVSLLEVGGRLCCRFWSVIRESK